MIHSREIVFVISSLIYSAGGCTLSLECASEENQLHSLCQDQLYFFRCVVNKSLSQIWKVNGSEVFHLLPFTKRDDFRNKGPPYIIPHTISPGTTINETSFISYLWFNASEYTAENITCECDSQSTHTITFNSSEVGCDTHTLRSGNVTMTSSAHLQNDRMLFYNISQYYYFQCSIKQSLTQIWNINGIETSLTPGVIESDYIPNEPLNFYVQNVSSNKLDLQADFISLIWFNSTNFLTFNNITCGDGENTVTLQVYEPRITPDPPIASGDASQVQTVLTVIIIGLIVITAI